MATIEPTGCPGLTELKSLRVAIGAANEVIFTTDVSGVFTFVNPAFERVYGYSWSEVVGCATPRVLKSGTTPSSHYARLWEQLLAGDGVRREFQNRSKSGDLLTVEASISPIRDEGGCVRGYVAIQRDVTSVRATEAALRESEHRYRALADAARDSIFIVNHLGRIEYTNEAGRATFGVPDDIAGSHLDDVFPPETAGEMWRQVSAVFESAQPQLFEHGFNTPSGEIWLEAWLVPMTNGAPRPHAVMGVARNITKRKMLEREFLQAQKMEAVGRLAGGIAHDFNNLLTAILGYSDFLLERLRDDAPEALPDVDEIKKAGERAARLTRQLLAFSRKQAVARQAVDLNVQAEDIQRMLGRMLGEDITLVLEPGANLWPVVVDPGQLEQVLLNLAVNARDAMPKGGRFTIATRNVEFEERLHSELPPGPYVELSVHDTGCGMTPEVLSHIFEPFFTTKPQSKGTGLGLATVYGIVTQNGGSLTVDSAPGVGTTFTIFWPRAEPGETAIPAGAGRRADRGSGETILLAEDESDVRALLRKCLERRGYRVLEAKDSIDAIRIAESYDGAIDLFVSDVIMPVMNGPDLAQRVVASRPSIRVLYISGFPSAVLPERCDGSRMWFLAKPFTPDDLAAQIRTCLETSGQHAPRP